MITTVTELEVRKAHRHLIDTARKYLLGELDAEVVDMCFEEFEPFIKYANMELIGGAK